MLEMRPNCECCGQDLSPSEVNAMICSFECTFCLACSQRLGGQCPNCNGGLFVRPSRSEVLLLRYPASSKRVLKANANCQPSVQAKVVRGLERFWQQVKM